MAKQKSAEYRNTEEYKNSVVEGQREWRNKLHGPEELHHKICENEKCGKIFEWFGRKETTKYKQARFCSISCSKTRTGFWNKNIRGYHVICFKYHEKKCIICGEQKIVAAHHYDENRENNEPLNLIPLCPTHHTYVHSKYRDEVMSKIDEWREIQKNSGKFE